MVGLRGSSELLLFDIETCAMPEFARLLPEPTPPKNYRDATKIQGYVRAARSRQIETAALDPDVGRIIAIGSMQPGVDDGPTAVLAQTEAEEREALQAFWESARSEAGGLKTLCGWNVVEFDLPYLLKRSLFLGVESPQIELTRFRHPDVLDLMQVWSVNGLLRPRPLDFVCRRLGVAVTDVGTGKDVGHWVTSGQWDSVRAHCENDILRLRGVSHRLGYVSIEPPSAPTSPPEISSRASAEEPADSGSVVASRENWSADLVVNEPRERGEAAPDYYLRALGDLDDFYGEDQDDRVREILDAAAQGSAEAQFVASMLYEEGTGVPPDDEQSVAWCRQAAKQDYPDAQLQLGLLHSSGRGVSRDLVEAYRWLTLAVENRCSSGLIKENARGCLERLEWRLSAQQLTEARQLVESRFSENPEA